MRFRAVYMYVCPHVLKGGETATHPLSNTKQEKCNNGNTAFALFNPFPCRDLRGLTTLILDCHICQTDYIINITFTGNYSICIMLYEDVVERM